MIAMLSFVLQEGNLDGSLQSSHPSIRIFLQGTQKGVMTQTTTQRRSLLLPLSRKLLK